MPIFTPEDEHRIRAVHERRASEDRKLFFDYFSDIAVQEITTFIQSCKEELLINIEQHARRYASRNVRKIPILEFKTFQQTSMAGKRRRRYLQEVHSNIVPGSYFKSLAGIHIVDLAAIYRNSNFRERLNEAIGSDMFYVTLTSQPTVSNEVAVREFENTLWLNVYI
jgi:hypothetical protein